MKNKIENKGGKIMNKIAAPKGINQKERKLMIPLVSCKVLNDCGLTPSFNREAVKFKKRG